MTANFVAFLLYVATVAVLASDPDSALRSAGPALLAVLGLPVFAAVALAVTRRPPPGPRRPR